MNVKLVGKLRENVRYVVCNCSLRYQHTLGPPMVFPTCYTALVVIRPVVFRNVHKRAFSMLCIKPLCACLCVCVFVCMCVYVCV